MTRDPSSDPETASSVRLLYTTFPDLDTAERIAVALVEARLIACANVFPPMRSIYRWEGLVTRETEVAAILKTTADRVEAIVAKVVAEHPYDTPAVLPLAVETGGAERFLAWVVSQTRPAC